ncbi:hypothetical protein [Chondrinema litorale]|uniref:hypothetical protein n=1 Tax=Chondrinema litorale TaxID=2994555 RepID=UPI002542F435|nr:hypothetical protein [Chondrinema litorale]UZR98466.1 hypothetical protein OQ292_32025 [Chondrinema litorale]
MRSKYNYFIHQYWCDIRMFIKLNIETLMTYTHYIFDNGMATRLTIHDDFMMDMERYDPVSGKMISDLKLLKKIDSDECDFERVSVDDFWEYIGNNRFYHEINQIFNPNNKEE